LFNHSGPARHIGDQAHYRQDQEHEEQDLRIFAMPTAPAAIPPKPKTAAISAMTKNTTA
jgi:hypothetical protein